MKKRQLNDPARPFQRPDASKHSGHIGPGPKPGPKRAVNVSIDAEILAVAKDMNLNLSQTLEDALRKVTEGERVRRFQEENREALESQREFFERYGTMSEILLGLRDDPSV